MGADDAKTLQRIIQAAEEMSANIRTLLALMRQGSEDMQLENFSLGELLEQLCHSYTMENPANATRLHFSRPEQDVRLAADKALVRMLLHNLISNALGHTEGSVTISLHPSHIEVRDQGGGADILLTPPSHDPKLASGLGLYIVNLACQKLGWRVEVTPSSAGTSIRVTFLAASPDPE